LLDTLFIQLDALDRNDQDASRNHCDGYLISLNVCYLVQKLETDRYLQNCKDQSFPLDFSVKPM